MKYPKTFGVFVVFLLTVFQSTLAEVLPSNFTNVTTNAVVTNLTASVTTEPIIVNVTTTDEKETVPSVGDAPLKAGDTPSQGRDIEVAYYTTAFIACGIIIGVVVIIGVFGYFFYQSALHQAQAMDQDGKDTESHGKDTDSEDDVEEEYEQTESEDESDDRGDATSFPSLPTTTAPQTGTNFANSTTQNSNISGAGLEESAPISSAATNFAHPVTVFEPPASAPASNFSGFPASNAPALPGASVTNVQVSSGNNILSAAAEFSEDEDESDSDDDDMEIIEDIPESPLVDASKTTGWTASGEGSGRFNFDNGGSILWFFENGGKPRDLGKYVTCTSITYVVINSMVLDIKIWTSIVGPKDSVMYFETLQSVFEYNLYNMWKNGIYFWGVGN